LADSVLKRKIDASHFLYLQEKIILPSEMAINVLGRKCAGHGLQISQNLILVSNIQEDLNVDLVVVEESPNKLIELVYRIMHVLSESVFETADDPSAHLFCCCNVIRCVKSQLDDNGGVRQSSVLQR
jgi:hypothetical protein